MPFVRVWIHLVWTTKNRQPNLEKKFRDRLLDHICQNAKVKGIYLDSINGSIDHIHVLLSIRSELSISKVAQLLKGESSHWANELKLAPNKIEWQEEYFAVSVSESDIGIVRNYILNQEEHHRRKTYTEEYQEFIQQYHGQCDGLKPAGERGDSVATT
ncbi:MAG: IS200/IS605 family transposase [Bacteroidota bacterium]